MGKGMTLQRLKKALENVFKQEEQPHNITDNKTTVCELMVHPGYKSIMGCGGCGEGPDLFACSDDREHELMTLRSSDIKEYLTTNNIQVGSFKELR